MKLSIIIPNHRSEATLPQTLRSLEAASVGLDVETLVCHDPEGRGLSWARNCGLDRATGDIVFFVDADDTVRPDFLRRLSETLVSTDSDFVLSSLERFPLRRAYDLDGNAAVREALLPAFFGYSLDDISRWNRGGDLMARRETGSVCRCAFRRAFLARHAIRFDETLRVFEDAPFLAECACRAERVVSIPDVLYDYTPGADGILSTYRRNGLYWPYKFAALANRRRLASAAGLDLTAAFGGSIVFTALEMLRHGRRELFAYLREEGVSAALGAFPLAWRHPLAAAGVSILRALNLRW